MISSVGLNIELDVERVSLVDTSPKTGVIWSLAVRLKGCRMTVIKELQVYLWWSEGNILYGLSRKSASKCVLMTLVVSKQA